MKITRLRVSELQQFRQPYELADLQDGLNLISGPNESGKSTLARALRWAFFERHRSVGAEVLRPFGDSAATPTIELDFELDGLPCHLLKSFLHKKRCELDLGPRHLEGAEAEDHLAERLGFQFALKGASKPEHWGIPGLLWIEQGAGHELAPAVGHAAGHLGRALDQTLGEVAASDGDEVFARVQALHDQLLTGTGKPRADYQQALQDAEQRAQQVQDLREQVQQYRKHVDSLLGLRQAHAFDEAEQPWMALREQQKQAQARLTQLEGLAQEHERARQALQRASGLRQLLEQQRSAAEQQAEDLIAREATLREASAVLEQASAALKTSQASEAEAAARWRQARELLALAQQEDLRATLGQRASQAQRRAGELGELLGRAQHEQERLAQLQEQAQSTRIDAQELNQLRQLQQALRDQQTRQAAVAMQLAFELDPGVQILLGEETLSGQGERLLLAPGTLQLPGLGRLHIRPGGDELDTLAREQERLQSEQRALCMRLGLDDLAAAEARERQHREQSADASAAAKALAVIAPAGVATLRAQVQEAAAQAADAQAALAKLPPPAQGDTPLLLDSARQRHDSSQAQAEAAAEQTRLERQALAAAQIRSEQALSERDGLRATLQQPERQAQLAARGRELLDAQAHEAAQKQALLALQEQIDAARPDIARQDVDRLRRSADALEREHLSRERQIVALEATLAAEGALGREEALAGLEGELAQAQRRAAQLSLRAQALALLLARLVEHRRALTQRLQAPLQKHIQHYLALLFPGAELAVEDSLAPGALVRPGPGAASPFDSLSFGAREQMGLICRLAYADLLQQAGRPTLLVLDDALVHSDEARLAQMKRVLFDAAQRHQVLLFTCHPGAWRDMGVPLRTLERAGA